eukprot:CAMPEP_0119339378 /NCGR_PEP_ID=MMETSP1333-20130426/98133_1 /TAXON_ID=418940 /ORGANISM="Scyphosphaera apsteinii, Strain RCC1455" /LENGTH=67 /DNA_ID=CAMNT_0007350881 /DNA_START=213 /DNA_END=416 /DNA_ORIENTATION=+
MALTALGKPHRFCLLLFLWLAPHLCHNANVAERIQQQQLLKTHFSVAVAHELQQHVSRGLQCRKARA